MNTSARLSRERLEEQLREELLQAEEELRNAEPEKRREALRRYQDVLYRFSRLVLDRKEDPGLRSPEISRAS